MLVECRWLQQLAAIPEVTEVPAFSQEAKDVLDQLATSFGVQDATAVKKACMTVGSYMLGIKVLRTVTTPCWHVQVESITNHDVKAIEYVIKDRIAHQPELAKVSQAMTKFNLPEKVWSVVTIF